MRRPREAPEELHNEEQTPMSAIPVVNAPRPPILAAEEAVKLVQSGDRVYLHEAAMAPIELMEALVGRAKELNGVETVSLHTEGPAPHVSPEAEGHIRHNALFIGKNVRNAVNEGRADFT